MKVSEKVNCIDRALATTSNIEIDGEPHYSLVDFSNAINYALDNITPQICIAFAEWCKWYRHPVAYNKTTTPELFDIFLKDYRP